MNLRIREKILAVCLEKIKQKGDAVQVSFYAFFANKNDDPVLLMNVARWWIEKHQLNHFEKATKIYAMVKSIEGEPLGKTTAYKGFNHLTFSVSDLDRSIAFYSELLGFSGEVRWATGAYLSYGNCWLCLSLGNVSSSQDYTHVAFSFDAAAMWHITQKDGFPSVTQWQKNTSEGDSLYLEDPDGHKLELHSGSLTTRLESLRKAPYDELEWLAE
ncbi:glutathione transferase [Marinomonas profundimaris]|uniref:Glutathione transferase n=2 Tax=Marinomonas profundimaris TaxID=1208321 RepID=W1S2S8_9GAMM|nr:glutathione transferase [Marinomonas profundimaris]